MENSNSNSNNNDNYNLIINTNTNTNYIWQEDIFDGQSEQTWWDNQNISYEEWSKSWEKSLDINNSGLFEKKNEEISNIDLNTLSKNDTIKVIKLE